MTSSTANDYAWTARSSWYGMRELHGCSLALVERRALDEALRLAGAVPEEDAEGVVELIECQEEVDGESHVLGASVVDGHGGDWTLLLAFDHGIGITLDHLAALSAGGRTAVLHNCNSGMPMDMFFHYRDGALVTGFEDPDRPFGDTPDALAPLLAEVGFDPAGNGDHVRAVFFALAERLTGVRLTEQGVREADFRVGPVEPVEAEEE